MNADGIGRSSPPSTGRPVAGPVEVAVVCAGRGLAGEARGVDVVDLAVLAVQQVEALELDAEAALEGIADVGADQRRGARAHAVVLDHVHGDGRPCNDRWWSCSLHSAAPGGTLAGNGRCVMLPANLLRAAGFLGALAVAMPAFAHPGEGLVGGFTGGSRHPVSGWDHVVAMVAVGLWGAFLGPPALWLLPVTFPLVMVVGGVLGILGVPIPAVETGIAVSAIALGL